VPRPYANPEGTAYWVMLEHKRRKSILTMAMSGCQRRRWDGSGSFGGDINLQAFIRQEPRQRSP